MPKQLNARIARLSLYMTCFVALFHCGSPEDVLAVSARDLQLSSQLAEVIGQLAVFAMSFFMAVSMYRLFSGLTLQTYGRKISRRVRSVLIPFVLWQLLFLALFKLQGADWSFRECLIRVFGFHMWPPDGPLWYLYSLFLLALLSPLLLIMRHRRLSLAGILLAICGLYSFRAEISAAIEGVFPGTYVGYTLTYYPAILLALIWGVSARRTVRALCCLTVCFCCSACFWESRFSPGSSPTTRCTFSPSFCSLSSRCGPGLIWKSCIRSVFWCMRCTSPSLFCCFTASDRLWTG